MNQDNFICAGIYMNEAWNMDDFPISGSFSSIPDGLAVLSKLSKNPMFSFIYQLKI